ncbi:Endoglucanase 15 [Dichanthelium oligosanthes]|uniref:Endoglucanase n=1 Tax=Dichanthelium oligosanthes TaxID=888268 RepID=A0A1E5V3Y7_9POAL|nr:Endoglucanase 15 [Dichanthelium oligosanthes]
MGRIVQLLAAVGLAALCCLGCTISSCEDQPDYRAALANSLLYFEGQRSGRLPADQRVQWRGDSALADGSDHGFGLPMAFTVMMLAWGVVEYARPLAAAGELRNALAAVRWGADYLATRRPCTFSVDASRPGSDVAAETAAAAVAFRRLDAGYSATLLGHAEQPFRFAKNRRGLYHNSVSGARNFYPSSGDELILEGKLPDAGNPAVMKSSLEQFPCNVVQHVGDDKLSPGGILWMQPWNNLQFVTSAAFVDYILGANPGRMSYMVGYGTRFPEQVHHRGAPVPSIKSSPGKITCKGGFDYFSRSAPNRTCSSAP